MMFNIREEKHTSISMLLGAIPATAVGSTLFFLYKNIWFLCFNDYPPHDFESSLTSILVSIVSLMFWLLFSMEIMRTISNYTENNSELYLDNETKNHLNEVRKLQHRDSRKRAITYIVKSTSVMVLSIFVTMAFYGFGVSFRIAEGISLFTVVMPYLLWLVMAYLKNKNK